MIWWRRRELNPKPASGAIDSTSIDLPHTRTIPSTDKTLAHSDQPQDEQERPLPRRKSDAIGNAECAPKCAPGSDVDADLSEVVEAWPALSDRGKAKVLDLIHAEQGQ